MGLSYVAYNTSGERVEFDYGAAVRGEMDSSFYQQFDYDNYPDFLVTNTQVFDSESFEIHDDMITKAGKVLIDEGITNGTLDEAITDVLFWIYSDDYGYSDFFDGADIGNINIWNSIYGNVVSSKDIGAMVGILKDWQETRPAWDMIAIIANTDDMGLDDDFTTAVSLIYDEYSFISTILENEVVDNSEFYRVYTLAITLTEAFGPISMSQNIGIAWDNQGESTGFLSVSVGPGVAGATAGIGIEYAFYNSLEEINELEGFFIEIGGSYSVTGPYQVGGYIEINSLSINESKIFENWSISLGAVGSLGFKVEGHTRYGYTALLGR